MKFRFPIIIIDEDFRSENTSGLGIRALAQAIDAAKHPMIWVGGGALDASAEITEVAERIGAPVGALMTCPRSSGIGLVSQSEVMPCSNPLPLALPGISLLPLPKKCVVTSAVIWACLEASMNGDLLI